MGRLRSHLSRSLCTPPAVLGAMDDPKPPEPDTPKPPGVEPNKPKDPSVYGGQWGDSGNPKPKSSPLDRPQRIKSPKGPTGEPDPDSPAPTG
jgi:hypothetical protein